MHSKIFCLFKKKESVKYQSWKASAYGPLPAAAGKGSWGAEVPPAAGGSGVSPGILPPPAASLPGINQSKAKSGQTRPHTWV